MSKTTVPWEKNPAHRKGLLNPDFVPNNSGTAYNIMTYMMSGAAPIETKTQGSARIYSFNIELQSNKWPGKLYVAWTDSPEKVQTIRLDMTQGGGVYALDYLGAEIQATKNSVNSDEPIAGSYSFQVGYEPVYIWDAGKPNR